MIARLRDLLLVDDVADSGAFEDLVAADVIDVEVRVDDRCDVAEVEPAGS